MLDRYSQEEMQQILQTASLLQQQEFVTRQQLTEIRLRSSYRRKGKG